MKRLYMNDEQLINAISNLSDAFYDMLEAIELESEYDTLICDDYPFDLSFDEMCVKVFNWKETMTDKLCNVKVEEGWCES